MPALIPLAFRLKRNSHRHALFNQEQLNRIIESFWLFPATTHIMSSQTAPAAEDGTVPLHVVFVPFVAPGHMNPMVDMARLFAAHGITSTIITTPCNALIYQGLLDADARLRGFPIRLQTVNLPGGEVGLPEGIENMAEITHPEMASILHEALMLTRDSIEGLLRDIKPDCLIADIFYPCLADLASQLNIPRLAFHGGNLFHTCVEHCLRLYAPHKAVSTDSEPFMVPGLPDEIHMTKLQLPEWITATDDGPLPEWAKHLTAARTNCYGTVLNTFTELEPGYEQLLDKFEGLKSWSIGPVSLWPCLKVARGNSLYFDEHETRRITSWLDSRATGSVVYVCFGTLTKVSEIQFRELALGLVSCGKPFIMVVSNYGDQKNLPDGFVEERMEAGNSYIIHGWAPQRLILKHPAVGGFVTHCGWNSILEAVCYGLPMVTWPQSGEQFYNEKLLTDVLKIGVAVGMSRWSNWTVNSNQELITRDKIQKVITQLMGMCEESEAMRKRAKELANAAMKAVDINGTSHTNLTSLIDELKSLKSKPK